MVLRELFAKLGLDVDGSSFAKGEAAIGGVRNLLVGLGVTLTAGAVARGLKGLVDYTYRAGWEAQRTAERVGVSAEALQELREAADDVGISGGAVEQGLRFLARNTFEAAQGSGELRAAFQRLGVAVKDGSGQIRGAHVVLMDLADAFARMPEAERPAAAMRLFGRSGAELIPLLKRGREGIAAMREEAQKAGNVLGQDALDAATDYHHALDALHDTVKGLRYSIGGPLLKEATRLAHALQKWIEANREILRQRIVSFVQGLLRSFEAFVGVAHGAVEALASMVKWLAEVAERSAFLKGVFIALGIAGAFALAPVLSSLAVLAIMLEDIWGWVTGKRTKTVMGELLGPFEELKKKFSFEGFLDIDPDRNPVKLALEGWIRLLVQARNIAGELRAMVLGVETPRETREKTDLQALRSGFVAAGVTGSSRAAVDRSVELARDPRFTELARKGDVESLRAIAREYGPGSKSYEAYARAVAAGQMSIQEAMRKGFDAAGVNGIVAEAQLARDARFKKLIEAGDFEGVRALYGQRRVPPLLARPVESGRRALAQSSEAVEPPATEGGFFARVAAAFKRPKETAASSRSGVAPPSAWAGPSAEAPPAVVMPAPVVTVPPALSAPNSSTFHFGDIHLHGAPTDSADDFVRRFEEQLALKLGIAHAAVVR